MREGLLNDDVIGIGSCDHDSGHFSDGSCLKCNGPQGLLSDKTCGPIDYEWIANGGCATADKDYPPEMSPDRVREILQN